MFMEKIKPVSSGVGGGRIFSVGFQKEDNGDQKMTSRLHVSSRRAGVRVRVLKHIVILNIHCHQFKYL